MRCFSLIVAIIISLTSTCQFDIIFAKDEEQASCIIDWDEDAEGELRVRAFGPYGTLLFNHVTQYWPEQWKEYKVAENPDHPGWIHAYAGSIVPRPEDEGSSPPWGIVIRIAGTPKPVAHPLHPSGQFFFALMPGGAGVLCRIGSESFEVGKIEAKYAGEVISLLPISMGEAVAYQLDGDKSLQDQSEWTEDEKLCWEALISFNAN